MRALLLTVPGAVILGASGAAGADCSSGDIVYGQEALEACLQETVSEDLPLSDEAYVLTAQAEQEVEPLQTLPTLPVPDDAETDQTAAGTGVPSPGDENDDSVESADAVESGESDSPADADDLAEDDLAEAAPAKPTRPSFTVTDVSKSMMVLKDCNVRAGPFNSEPVIKIAFHDSVVQANGWVQGPDWYRIQLDDGREGYIHGSLLEETTDEETAVPGRDAPAAPTYYVPGQSPTGSIGGRVPAPTDTPSQEQMASQSQVGPGGPDGPSNTLPSFPSYALPKPEVATSDRGDVARDADDDDDIAQRDEVRDDAQVVVLRDESDDDEPVGASDAAVASAPEPEIEAVEVSPSAGVSPSNEDLRQTVDTVVTSSIENAQTQDGGAAEEATLADDNGPNSVEMAANTAPAPALEGREFSPEPRTKPTLGDLAARSAMRVPDPSAVAAGSEVVPTGEASGAVAALDKTMYISEDAEVHAEPSYSSELITVLHAPNAIKVTGWVEEAGWYRVAMLDGGTGFVSALMLSEEFLIPSMDILQNDDESAEAETSANTASQGAAVAGLSGDWYVSHVKILDADYAQPKPEQPTFTGKGEDGKLEIFEAGRLRYSLSVDGDTFLGTEFNYSCGQFTELPVRGSVSDDGILSIEYQMMMDGCSAVPPKGPVIYQLTRF